MLVKLSCFHKLNSVSNCVYQLASVLSSVTKNFKFRLPTFPTLYVGVLMDKMLAVLYMSKM